jgi:hypothetical protein
MIIAISGKIGSGKDLVGKIVQYLTSVDSFNITTNIKNEIIPVVTTKDNGINYYRDTKTFEEYLKDLKVKGKISFTKWKIKKFADKLKDIVCLLINCTREQLEDADFKEKELGEEWNKWRISCSSDYHTEKKFFNTKEECLNFKEFETSWLWDEPILIKLTPRLLLQLLGTDCGRNLIHPNIWINSLMNEYKSITLVDGHSSKDVYPNWWIITDVRFPNELEAVKSRKGITIRVNRDKEKDCNLCGKTIREQKKGCNEISCYKQFLKKEHLSETALDNTEFDYVIDNNGSISDLIDKVKQILIKERII